MSFTPKTAGHIYGPKCNVFFGPMRDGYTTHLRADNIVSCTTQKSLSSPTGTFEIVMNYDPNHKGGSGIDGKRIRWSEILAPNDYVEIYMSHDARQSSKVVLYGWIDNVTVSEQAGTSGPILRIVVNGRDYGKVWLVTKILNIAPGVPVVTYATQYHIDWASTDLPKLFEQVMTNIAKPYVDYHQRRNNFVKPFVADDTTISPDAGFLQLILASPDNFLEVVYTILSYYAAKPWIELLVEDYEDGPHMIIRWAPLRSSNNVQLTGLLEGYPQQIVSHDVQPIIDIVEESITRSDTDVFNWIRAYWDSAVSVQEQDFGAFSLAGQVPYVIGKSIDMYGLRTFPPHFQYYPNGQGLHRADITADKVSVDELVRRFTLWCAMMYGHNYALENGSLRVFGLPVYKIGEELIVYDKTGVAQKRFYIEGVRHEFTWGQPYYTTLNVTRGMPVNGFPEGGLTSMTPYSLPESLPSSLIPEVEGFLNMHQPSDPIPFQ